MSVKVRQKCLSRQGGSSPVKAEIYAPHICGSVCQILVFVGLPVAKYALRRAAQSFEGIFPQLKRKCMPPHVCRNVCQIKYLRGVRGKSAMRAWCFWPRTGPQVNVLGIHFRSKGLGHIFPLKPCRQFSCSYYIPEYEYAASGWHARTYGQSGSLLLSYFPCRQGIAWAHCVPDS